MTVMPVDNAAVRDALRAATDRLVEFLEGVDQPDAPIPGSEWTIRLAAAHVVAGLADYGESLTGTVPLKDVDPSLGPTNAQIRAVNAVRMDAVRDRDLRDLAGMIDRLVTEFIAGTDGLPADTPYDWYGKIDTTLGAMTGIMLGEVVLHGYDMARAAEQPWPIDRRDATLILLGALALLPAYVDAASAQGVTSSYEISLRGGPEPPVRIGVRFSDGAAEVDYPPRPPFDCRMSCDPVAMLLVSYGRIKPWGPILSGRLVAVGRKPWRGLTFPRLLTSP